MLTNKRLVQRKVVFGKYNLKNVNSYLIQQNCIISNKYTDLHHYGKKRHASKSRPWFTFTLI